VVKIDHSRSQVVLHHHLRHDERTQPTPAGRRRLWALFRNGTPSRPPTYCRTLARVPHYPVLSRLAAWTTFFFDRASVYSALAYQFEI